MYIYRKCELSKTYVPALEEVNKKFKAFIFFFFLIHHKLTRRFELNTTIRITKKLSLGKRTQAKLFLDKQGARISSGILHQNTHYSKGRKKRNEYISDSLFISSLLK